MKNILAVDIGNTNITVGLFKGTRLVKKAKIATAEPKRYVRRLKNFLPWSVAGDLKVVISSVVPQALKNFKQAAGKVTCADISVLGRNARVPVQVLVKVKKEVGQDRLVNAYAAAKLYGTPAIIIDLGTAITFDIVSKRGAYLGGLILPGIEMSLSSLYEKTALLPKVKLAPARYIIGKDTVECMRGGILFGLGTMCDGLVAQYRKILGKNTKVIATGGNARLIKRYARSIQIVDDDLTLKGLRLLA